MDVGSALTTLEAGPRYEWLVFVVRQFMRTNSLHWVVDEYVVDGVGKVWKFVCDVYSVAQAAGDSAVWPPSDCYVELSDPRGEYVMRFILGEENLTCYKWRERPHDTQSKDPRVRIDCITMFFDGVDGQRFVSHACGELTWPCVATYNELRCDDLEGA